jgi:hypothetical protein
MPLNASERNQVVDAFFMCFGEEAHETGRALKFMSVFTVGQVDLLATLATRAFLWQPFIDSGLSIQAWVDDVTRIYNTTQTT